MNETCRMLSNALRFQTLPGKGKVEVAPCCIWQGKKYILGEPGFNEWRNYLRALDARVTPECRYCREAEKLGLNESWREKSFNLITEDKLLIELQIDTTCNGGCIICGPELSSVWRKEIGNIQKKENVEQIVNNVLNLIDDEPIGTLKFLGGEPFLSDSDKIILSKIKDQNVSLIYTTNGSIFPSDDRLELFKNHQIKLAMSIDGIGDRFEYIRYPLKWKIVEENIERFKALNPEKIKVSYTVNILNMYYYDEFVDWLSTTHPGLEHTVYPADGVLSPRFVPKKLQDMIKDKHGASHIFMPWFKEHSNQSHRYLTQLDNRRGTNWRTIFPEISEIFS